MSIILRDIKKSYNGRTVLHIESLSVEKSGVTVLMGSNGCGKTTLLRLMCGIEPDDSGRMIADCRNDMALMMQKPYLFDRSVEKNIALCCPKGFVLPNAVLDALDLPPILPQNAQKLSGGQAQKTALACTIAADKPILLLDEPTAAADPNSTYKIERLLLLLKAQGKTILMATHNPAQAARIADWVLMMDAGRVVEQGCASQVLERPKHSQTKAFLGQFIAEAPIEENTERTNRHDKNETKRMKLIH